jgi:hypothetical protein
MGKLLLLAFLGSGIGNPMGETSYYPQVFYDDLTVAALTTRTPAANAPGLEAFPAGEATKTLCFDAATGDACLLAIDFHFQKDQPGSISETTK